MMQNLEKQFTERKLQLKDTRIELCKGGTWVPKLSSAPKYEVLNLPRNDELVNRSHYAIERCEYIEPLKRSTFQ